MTTIELAFILGLTAGGALTWLMSLIVHPARTTAAEDWTVAAITSRIERERTDVQEAASHVAGRPNRERTAVR